MKNFKLYISALLMLVLTISSVFALTLPLPTNFNLPNVVNNNDIVTSLLIKVDGIVADQNTPVRVERGQLLPVELFFRGNPNVCTNGADNPCYDVRARVFIGGYEYGDVQALTSIFEVEGNVDDSKELLLRIPTDIPASDDYTLNVQVFDNHKTTIKVFKLRLQESRHNVELYDVLFNPINNVRSGQALFTTVRLENLGDNIESNIKVTVSIPALGIQTSQFVDQLVSEQELVTNSESTGRDAATTNDLVLLIPQDAKEGDYEIVVNVNYNRGFSNTEKKYVIHVKGSNVVPQTGSTLNVNVDNTLQRITAGQGGVYKFSLSNLGQTSSVVNFEVTGNNFGNVRVDPQTLVIEPNSAKDAFVYASPNEGLTGLQTFTVKLKDANGNVLSEKVLSLDIAVQTKLTSDTTKTVLMIGFVVLLILLIVLSIVVIVKKLSDDDDKPVEGQTYY